MIGLIGKSLKHSYSKELYQLSINKKYKLIELKKVDKFLKQRKFEYVNVTYPFKKSVIPFLDCKSKIVEKTGVCNLIVNRGGKLFGYNTDASGFDDLLDSNDVNVTGKTILILGNGATKETVVYCLKKRNVKKIIIACRNKKDESEFYFNEISGEGIEIIINATPVGQQLNDENLIDFSLFKNLETYIDLVYNPKTTNMMFEAKKLKKGSINGLTMLVSQAKLSHSIATGIITPSAFWARGKMFLQFGHSNIIFIGLPTAGKTKNINYISSFKILKTSVIDTDKAIEKSTNMSIAKLFKNKGETYFRQEENKIINRIYTKQGLFIATGGGTLLNYENYRKLSYFGTFIYLKKQKFDDYINDGTRPLAKSKNDIEKLYQERKKMYEEYADITVPSDIDPKQCLFEVINALTNN
ncbi:MAG: hypothetical protein H6687_01065 [Bacillales bacterium]|nr:hypothetical protein [Bacillales bacterium]